MMTTRPPLDEPTDPAERTADVDVDEPSGDPSGDLHDLVTQFVTHARSQQSQKPISATSASDEATRPMSRGFSEVFQSLDGITPNNEATQPLSPVKLEPASREEPTSPGLMPVPHTGAEAARERRGEIKQLLASIGPFLWSLEGALKWIDEHGHGDGDAQQHVRALGLLARVLSQLQARVDEV
ncbi:MAG TPA: hypothetical protein VGO62_17110 [Myxococcota bacterium]